MTGDIKMQLSVIERILLSQLLPVEGNFTNLKLIRQVKEELSFTEEENQKLKFVQKDTQVIWNPVADLIKEIIFGEVVLKLIKDTLIKLDQEEKLTDQHMSLYEKFITI